MRLSVDIGGQSGLKEVSLGLHHRKTIRGTKTKYSLSESLVAQDIVS